MRDVIADAYAALRRVTPLPNGLDCGRLCGGRCCKGTANDGMELFHGEEKRFLHDPDFTVRESNGRKLLICSGKCDRRSRPLACRMYPLFPVPYETDEGRKIRVVYDLRGFAACPVVREQIRPDARFVQAVRLAGMYLARDPENLRIMRETNALFDELVSFTQTIRNRGSGNK
jgi:Fe-S-cluster containining protein